MSCAKTAEPIDLPIWVVDSSGPNDDLIINNQLLFVGYIPVVHPPRLPQDAQVQSYSPGGANVPSLENTLPPPGEYESTNRLGRRCALCQITLTTCYLWTRSLRQSHR